MKLSFDKFERYELPQVTLCNPNSRATEVDGKTTITDTVGVLSNPKGMNLKLNFNAPHELTFDYYRHKSSDPIKQSFYDSIYEAIQTDRYIYLTDIGYFIISSVTDSDEDNIDKKSITFKSCEENELATAEGLFLKEGTYYLHTDNSDGLLDLFLPKTVGWTMGYIDPSLLAKPYYVEETEVDNGYNFLYTTIQDMFECIVEPDIIKRTISVYSRAYYTENHLTDIHLAKHNLLKHKVVEDNDEDKFTALNVQGKDESLEIRIVNPTGKNVIYNFEPRYSWMSSELQTAIEKWQEKCEAVIEDCTQYVRTLSKFQGGYVDLQEEYYTELEKLFNKEKDIEVLNGELKQLEATKDAAWTMAAGDEKNQSLINVNNAIADKLDVLDKTTSDYEGYKVITSRNYEVPINQINADCALDTTAVDIHGNAIFTTALLNELMTHIKPTDYIDEYMLVTESMTYPQKFEKAKELMDRAQSQLVKISSGQKTYSIDTRSFLFNKQFKHFSEQLCAGAIIYAETKRDTMEQLHLTGIDIDFDAKTTNFTLGNKYDRSDLKALYEDTLGQNSKSFSELKYIASIIEDQQKQLDYQRNWVADLRTLTLNNVLTSEDQAFEINNRGIIGRKRRLDENSEWDCDENGNPYFEDEQVKLINNTLVFTEDNWNTASTAVGKIAVGYNADGSVKYAYGINGQVLIGELILGNNLVLTGTGAGIKIKDSNGKDAFYADDDGNLVLSSTIYAKHGEIGGCTIDEFGIYSGSEDNTAGIGLVNQRYAFWAGGTIDNTGGAKFVVNHNGNLYAANATIIGKINATSGKIGDDTYGGFEIGSGTLQSTGVTNICWPGMVGLAPGATFDDTYGHTSNYSITGLPNSICIWAGAPYENEHVRPQRAAFRVTRDGSLYATKGNIGGWSIGNGGGLFFNNGSTGCGLWGTTAHANIAIHAGGSTGNIGGAPFRVYHDGSLVATNANISGEIDIGNATYYLRMGNWTKHPEVSGLNVGSGGININGVGFNYNNSEGLFEFAQGIKGSTIYASARLRTSYIEAQTSINLLAGNSSGDASNGGILLRTGNSGHITLDAANGGGIVYAQSAGYSKSRVYTAAEASSSKNVKEKIQKFSNGDYDDALNLLKNIDIYSYDYKYNLYKNKHQYGFIIDEIETQQNYSRFFDFSTEKAMVVKDYLDFCVEEDCENEVIDVKQYNRDTLDKFLLTCIKGLQNTVAELKTQIQTLTAG